jgi:hypothetical protein
MPAGALEKLMMESHHFEAIDESGWPLAIQPPDIQIAELVMRTSL